MEGLIGNTPMIEISYRYKEKIRKVYAKLEYYNLTGSIKDRIVYHILTKHKKNGNIKEGMPLIEATSGNTGISLAAIGAYYKHPVYIIMPDFVSTERKKLIASFGAHIKQFSKEEGGYERCIHEADLLAEEIGGYRLDQFANIDNVGAHYTATATEIMKKMERIDGFVSGYGTGGTLMGVGLKLKDMNENVCIAVIEPEEMALISKTGKNKDHQIEGISDGFVPALIDKEILDRKYTITDKDAVNMSKLLSRELGLGVGYSSGINFLGSILLEEEIEGNIVTVFPDDSKKYLSTGFSEEANLSKEYISNQIELLSYKIV